MYIHTWQKRRKRRFPGTVATLIKPLQLKSISNFLPSATSIMGLSIHFPLRRTEGRSHLYYLHVCCEDKEMLHWYLSSPPLSPALLAPSFLHLLFSHFTALLFFTSFPLLFSPNLLPPFFDFFLSLSSFVFLFQHTAVSTRAGVFERWKLFEGKGPKGVAGLYMWEHAHRLQTPLHRPLLVSQYKPSHAQRRGNSFKLKDGRFRLDIRNKLSIMGVLRAWNRLPREAVCVCRLPGSVQGQAG